MKTELFRSTIFLLALLFVGMQPVHAQVEPPPVNPDATETVLAWGNGVYGQLGLGGCGLVQAEDLSNVVALSGGQYHSLALDSGGNVWAWGHNGYGQLGDGATTKRSSPVPVVGLTESATIGARSTLWFGASRPRAATSTSASANEDQE